MPWIATWPTTDEKLALYAAAVELHEWVALKDRLSRLEPSAFSIALEPVVFDPNGLSALARAYRITGRDLPTSWARLYAVFRNVEPEREGEAAAARARLRRRRERPHARRGGTGRVRLGSAPHGSFWPGARQGPQ